MSETTVGGDRSLEAEAARDAGLSVDVVSATQWAAMTAADFATYRALILGDPGTASPRTYQAAADNAAVWGGVVTGNVVIIGTDPVDHRGSGGEAIVRQGVVYAANDIQGTGLYTSLLDAYDATAAGTEIEVLAGLADGEAFIAQGSSCYESAHVIVEHPVIDQVSDESLSNWGCSVHNTFTAYPAGFVPLAIALGQGDFVAPDGTVGFPYILARGRTTTLAGRKVVALGDSVSAGEGIAEGWIWKPEGTSDGQWEQEGPRFAWDTTFTTEYCHQTPQAHPRVVAAELSAFIAHLSCTGSTADNGVLGNRTDGGEIKAVTQLGPVYDAAQPDITTVSLGANDIEFADIVTECVKPHPRFFDDSDCRFTDEDLDERYDTQASGLRRVLDDIRRRGALAGKQPLVVLTQYADPFPLQWTDSCPDLDIPVAGLTISKSEVDFMRGGLRRLNASIASVAAEYDGVVVAAPPSAYGDHRFCAQDPWTYGPSLIFDKSFDGLHEGFDFGTSKTPFHPTPDGQRALAAAVRGAIASKVTARVGSNVTVRTPTGPRITFGDVSLAGAVVADPRTVDQLPPTGSFRLQKAWEIATSAMFSGPVRIALPASPGDSIWHYTAGRWTELATDFANGFASAFTNGFSPFAVGPRVGAVTARVAPTGAGQAPVDITFDASTSSVEGGAAIAEVSWDFGDGSTATGAAPTHRFVQSGRYDVVAKVTSSEGATDEARTTVVVTNAEPTPIVAAPTSAVVGELIRFDGSTSSDPNGRLLAHEWDFVDGSPAALDAVTTHAFSRPGQYHVRLLVRDDEGAEATAVHIIEIVAPANPPSPDPPATVPPDVTAPGTVPPVATPPGTTPAKPKRASLSVLSARRRGKTIVVKLRCRRTSTCSGRLIVRAGKRELGRLRFRLKGKATKTVTVRLRRAAPRRPSVRVLAYLGNTRGPISTAVVRRR